VITDKILAAIDKGAAWLRLLPARAKVVSSSIVTRLLALAGAITAGVEAINPYLPEHVAVDVGRWSGIVLVWIAAVVEIVRRVTTVLEAQRGVLGPKVETSTVINLSSGP
jgi:hypothetical protein